MQDQSTLLQLLDGEVNGKSSTSSCICIKFTYFSKIIDLQLSLFSRLETGMHLAEAALIFNQPTVVQLPLRGSYLYAPNSTMCPNDDWTCYVHPLTSCNESHLLESNEWREPYELTWFQKTLKHAKQSDPYLLKAWDEVIRDLGGGSVRYGQRGLAMIARSYATRPLPRMEKEVRSILGEQDLMDNESLDGCLAIHLRRSDNHLFQGGGRPINFLAPTVGLAEEILGPIREGRKVLLLSDTELDKEELDSVAGTPLVMLHRFRGETERAYADHLPTKNATLEVAYIYAEQELLSKCNGFVYQQGAFAGLLWETMCRSHGGWETCLEQVTKVAMCDVCCDAHQMEIMAFNVSQQSCRRGRDDVRIPDWACPGVNFCL